MSRLVVSSILFFCITGGFTAKGEFIREGETLVIVGNTFAEDLSRYSYFETLLYESFPGRQFRVRNLGWSGDEVGLQPRPLHFPTLEQQLLELKADVIFLCFGLNESFQGEEGLADFAVNLETLLKNLKNRQFNGRTPPRLYLIGPIAYEQLHEHLPEATEINREVERYGHAMMQIADKHDIPFLELFHSFTASTEVGPEGVTRDGIHLNDEGHRMAARFLTQQLGLPIVGHQAEEWPHILQQLIDEKNRHFFYYCRPSNSEYLVGRRKDWAGGQTLVAELENIGQMIGRLDGLIWSYEEEDQEAMVQQLQEIISYDSEVEGIFEPKEQYQPDKESFVLKEGFEIELYASERNFPIENPVAMNFDAKGRLWIASMPTYPHYLPGLVPRDKLVILSDQDGDGRADAHRIFAENLYIPLGFEFGHGGVYLSQAPDLLFLKDHTGDDRADDQSYLLHGFGTEDSHHSMGNFSWSPSGKLNLQMGTFLHTQVETPYGPQRGVYGTTWQFDPENLKLDNYISYPYANPWGNVFNEYGDHLIADASTGRCYYATPLNVAIDYPKKHTVHKGFLTTPKHPKTCGIEIISSQNFPQEVQGDILLNTFVGFQGIRHHRLIKDGSGYTAKELAPLLQSKDQNFRPVDLKFGPDGALYVLDWFSPIVQHGEQGFREALRDHAHGRVWRITYIGKPTTPVTDLSSMTIRELLDQLKSKELRERYRARVSLSDYPEEEVVAELDALMEESSWFASDPDHLKLEVLWMYVRCHSPNLPLLVELLNSDNEDIRTAAVRVLRDWYGELDQGWEQLQALAQDPSPKVRLEAVASISHFETEAVVMALLGAMDQPLDQHLEYALKEAFVHLHPVWMRLFQEDPQFLADDQLKADFLFQLLRDSSLTEIPGFLRGDPDWQKQAQRLPLLSEHQALSDAVAYQKFLADNPLEQPQNNQREEPQDHTIRLTLKTLPGKMMYDQDTIRVEAGKQVELVFVNNDNMVHNIVFVKEGFEESVGTKADQMASEPDAQERQYIPESEGILFYSPLVDIGESFTLNFTAPSEKGSYPFLCTFPGHWRIMRGILVVE
ncbi:MAG: GDSL-type esterase/lipase family protein [Opitutales bacterium]|nr:GDSL-type esterase/lipase family protein [Opitutales bacterium]